MPFPITSSSLERLDNLVAHRLRKVETPARAGGQINARGRVRPLVGNTAAARLRETLAGEKGQGLRSADVQVRIRV